MDERTTATPARSEPQATPAERDRSAAIWFEQRCGLRLTLDGERLMATATRDQPEFNLAQQHALRLLAPASDSALAEALAALSLRVTRQGGDTSLDDATAELQMRLYIADLRAYPEDIALHVLSRWHHVSTFWPSWKDLQDALDKHFRWRRGLLSALQNVKRIAPTDEPRPSDDDKLHVRNLARDVAAKLRAAKPISGLRSHASREAELERVRQALADDLEAEATP